MASLALQGTVPQGLRTRMDGDKHAIWGETIGASQGEGNAPESVVYVSCVS